MLSPDERQKVEATAGLQHLQDALVRAGYPGIVAPATRAPWFHTTTGRPIWLTPDDRTFLREHGISAN